MLNQRSQQSRTLAKKSSEKRLVLEMVSIEERSRSYENNRHPVAQEGEEQSRKQNHKGRLLDRRRIKQRSFGTSVRWIGSQKKIGRQHHRENHEAEYPVDPTEPDPGLQLTEHDRDDDAAYCCAGRSTADGKRALFRGECLADYR